MKLKSITCIDDDERRVKIEMNSQNEAYGQLSPVMMVFFFLVRRGTEQRDNHLKMQVCMRKVLNGRISTELVFDQGLI